MRHSFATQLLRAAYDMRTVQEQMGQRDLDISIIYLHVFESEADGRSPHDLLRYVPHHQGAGRDGAWSTDCLKSHS
ncbi:MAG: tyrosine-type recombinase/integrase [Gemmatimonadaceae bacterium]|nr:tyrosine-type recombinase/integrase [Gemmatimonadaceae bacterium]